MKKLSTILLLLVMLHGMSGGTAFAQGLQDADQTSAQVSKKMMQSLRLNEWEYIKVKELNLARINKMTKAVTLYSHDPAGLETRLAEVEKEFEANLAAVLKKETFESYAQFKMTPEGDLLSMLKKASAPEVAPVK